MTHKAQVTLHGRHLTFQIVAVNDHRCPDCQREIPRAPGEAAAPQCPCKKRAQSVAADQAHNNKTHTRGL